MKIQIRKLTLTLLLALLVCASAQAQVTVPLPGKSTADLVDMLQSDESSVWQKAMACEQLAIAGDESAVPALISAVTDPRLAQHACSALENMPGDAAVEALREALDKYEGVARAEVVLSLGKLGDAESVDAIAALLPSEEEAVAPTAARALAYIADNAAGEKLLAALQEAISENDSDAIFPLVNGCMKCAFRMVEKDNAEGALKLTEFIRGSNLRPRYVREATILTLFAQGEKAMPLLNETLKTNLPVGLQAVALMRTQERMPAATEVATAMAVLLEDAPAGEQAVILPNLGWLGDDSVFDAAAALVDSQDALVRQRVVETLAKLDSAKALPYLFRASIDESQNVADAARGILGTITGDKIDAVVLGYLEPGKPKTETLAGIAMASNRSMNAAAKPLLNLATSEDNEVSASAIQALRSTTTLEDYPALLQLALNSQGTERGKLLQETLSNIALRMPQQPCAAILCEAMGSQDTTGKVLILEQLRNVGGPQALAAIGRAARSGDETQLDAATRLVGTWPAAEVAPLALELAEELPDGRYQLRALRGSLRVARQLDMPLDERLGLCRKALQLSTRLDEKKLILEVMRRYPSTEGMDLSLALAAEAELRDEALQTLLAASSGAALRDAAGTLELLKKAQQLIDGNTELGSQFQQAVAQVEEFAKLQAQHEGFTQLFDRHSLTGWSQPEGGIFYVRDGALTAGTPDKAMGHGNNTLTYRGRKFYNFELYAKARLLGNGNGGIFVRCALTDRQDGAGYQVDLGRSWYGCLYDEVRRQAMLATANPRLSFEDGTWVTYRVRCEGPRIRIWVNGKPTVDYVEQNPEFARQAGFIALQGQVNGAAGRMVQYTDLFVRELADDELKLPKPALQTEPTPTPEESEFTSLFDGETLDGWKGNMDFWSVDDGAIVGGSLTEMVKNNEFLRTKKEYSDFELRLQFKLLGERTNGGVQIRTQEIPDHHEVIGYQADLGNGWWGCLYDESRRRRVLAGPPAAERTKPVKIGQWNDYRIRCEGRRIQLWINNTQTVDYTEPDPDIPQKGIIAVQVHGNLKMKAHYKNIRITEL